MKWVISFFEFQGFCPTAPARRKRKAKRDEEEDDEPHRDELSDDDHDEDWGQGRQQDEVLRVTTV